MRHSAIRILAIVAAAGVVLALAPASVAAQAKEPYTLGQGLPLGASGVRLGGYLAVEFEKAAGEEPLFLFDDLSLFLRGLEERTAFRDIYLLHQADRKASAEGQEGLEFAVNLVYEGRKR